MTTEIDEHFYFVLEGPKCPYSELLEKVSRKVVITIVFWKRLRP